MLAAPEHEPEQKIAVCNALPRSVVYGTVQFTNNADVTGPGRLQCDCSPQNKIRQNGTRSTGPYTGAQTAWDCCNGKNGTGMQEKRHFLYIRLRMRMVHADLQSVLASAARDRGDKRHL